VMVERRTNEFSDDGFVAFDIFFSGFSENCCLFHGRFERHVRRLYFFTDIEK